MITEQAYAAGLRKLAPLENSAARKQWGHIDRNTKPKEPDPRAVANDAAVLALLTGPMTNTQIAEAMHMHPNAIWAITRRLHAKGLVTQTRDRRNTFWEAAQ